MVLFVSNGSDTVNGNTSSVSALIANPGNDGISLREAVLAVNATSGVHTIVFASGLTGQTIFLNGNLPELTRSGVTLTGLVNPDGTPAITIAGGGIGTGMLCVAASDIAVSHLRFIPGSEGAGFGITVMAGLTAGIVGPLSVENVRIEDNAFTNSGLADAHSVLISVQTAKAPNASVSNVLIARNTFTDISGYSNGVLVQVGSADGLVRDLTIQDNRFSNVALAIELAAAHAIDSRIEGSRIIGNTFTGIQQSVGLNHVGFEGEPATSGNVIDETLIAGNYFSGNLGFDIMLVGGMTNATGNAITNTIIVNNFMGESTASGAVNMIGGLTGGNLNLIDGVQIINNTMVQKPFAAIDAKPDLGGTGNVVANVAVVSTLFNANAMDISGVGAENVSFSLTSQSGFAGVNGNISGDPRFVDAAHGDFRLQAGSPAIDAGLADVGPFAHDIDGNGRVDDLNTPNTGVGTPPFTDVGAFEFSGGPTDDALGGTDGSDALNGGAGNDLLNGGAGDDTLDGGADVDTASYGGAGSGVTVSLSAAGAQDTVGAGTDRLIWIENLTGSAFIDTLTGNSGDNALDGGAGADTMIGGSGNDTYVVDNAGDVVTEFLNEGSDTVQTAVQVSGLYTLGANVENLTLTGTANLNGAGNTQDNVLTGNAGNNFLDGGDGNDVLLGGDGDDALIGRAGVDQYDGGAGMDTVYLLDSSIVGTGSILGAGHIDRIADMLGPVDETRDATGDTFTGIERLWSLDANVNDSIRGTAADDVIVTGGGDDDLVGRLGADVLDGSDGFDTVWYESIGGTGLVVDWLLPAASTGEAHNDILVGIERIFGAGLNDEFRGGNGNEVLAGGGGDDILDGRLGDDILDGGPGNDIFIGGLGRDVYIGQSGADRTIITGPADSTVANPDIIVGFESGADKLDLTLTRTGPSDAYSFTPTSEGSYLNVDLGGNGSVDMTVDVRGIILASDLLW